MVCVPRGTGTGAVVVRRNRLNHPLSHTKAGKSGPRVYPFVGNAPWSPPPSACHVAPVCGMGGLRLAPWPRGPIGGYFTTPISVTDALGIGMLVAPFILIGMFNIVAPLLRPVTYSDSIISALHPGILPPGLKYGGGH